MMKQHHRIIVFEYKKEILTRSMHETGFQKDRKAGYIDPSLRAIFKGGNIQ
jgi:hypothetical protein